LGLSHALLVAIAMMTKDFALTNILHTPLILPIIGDIVPITVYRFPVINHINHEKDGAYSKSVIRARCRVIILKYIPIRLLYAPSSV
jgi:hypothetical protein